MTGLSRREFLGVSAALTGPLGFQVAARASPLRVLILGGTGFIGPHQVRYARQRGHALTLFNRGRTNPGLFPQIETLHGDRSTGDYASLTGRDWDVVIDNPTTLPRWVREAAAVLAGHTKQYIFVSTLSVYAGHDQPDADETAALSTTDKPGSEDVRAHYGPLKALSEQAAQAAYPGLTTIIRPGLIVGPGDLTDRFTYWPVRLQRGGEVLAPGLSTDPVQIIDARDLSEFIVRCAERGTTGVFNCCGPRGTLTMAEMLGGVRSVLSSSMHLTWVDAGFLARHGVRAWSDMPVWISPSGAYAGFHRRSIRRALDNGLTFRTLADTTQATLEHYASQPEDRKVTLRAGLDPAREKAVLAAWHARASKP